MSAVMISRAASSLERRPSQMNCGSARHAWKSGSSRHSSSFRAPTNSTTSSSPIASPTSRSSFQSVRRPFVPKQTAITAASGSGAGNESAAEGMRMASRPGAPLQLDQGRRHGEYEIRPLGRLACAVLRGARAVRGEASGAAGVRSNRPYQSSHPGQRATTARAKGSWKGWNIIATTGLAVQAQTPRLRRGEGVAEPVGQAAQRAVGHPRRVHPDDPGGAQEVLPLVVEDEALDRARHEEQGDRRGRGICGQSRRQRTRGPRRI